MLKSAGNGRFLVWFFLSSLTADGASLRLTTEQGKPLSNPQKGVTFIIEIAVDDNGENQTVQLDGLNNFQVIENHTSRTIYIDAQGTKKSKKYNYHVQALQEGACVIGPAHLTSSSGVTEVPSISVTIDPPTSTHENISTDPVRIELDLLKSAVVHQKIPYRLRFLYKDPSITLNRLSLPTKPEVTWVPQTRYHGQPEERDGVTYNCFIEEGFAHASCDGDFALGSAIADYTYPVKPQKDTIWDSFRHFFGSQVRTERILSLPIGLTVTALPPYHELITSVGEYTGLIASATPSQLSQGEALEYKITVVGSGNDATLSAPALDLPDGCRYYPPTRNHGNNEYTFCYILQMMQSGDCIIPAQKFTFFSAEAGTYVTLLTQPVTITVRELPASAIGHDNNTIIETGTLQFPVTSPKISDSIFFSLIIIPLLLIAARRGYIKWTIYQQKKGSPWKKWRAYKKAQYSLKKAMREQDIPALYAIFTDFSKLISLKSEDSASQAFNIISLNGLSPADCAAWHDWWRALLEATFSKSVIVPADFYDQAKDWMTKLYRSQSDYKK
jgi:hypothetical protein